MHHAHGFGVARNDGCERGNGRGPSRGNTVTKNSALNRDPCRLHVHLHGHCRWCHRQPRASCPELRPRLALDRSAMGPGRGQAALGGFMLPTARASGMFSRRQLLLSGLVAFMSAAMTSAVGGGSAVLIGGQAVQGVGAAVLATSTLACLWSKKMRRTGIRARLLDDFRCCSSNLRLPRRRRCTRYAGLAVNAPIPPDALTSS